MQPIRLAAAAVALTLTALPVPAHATALPVPAHATAGPVPAHAAADPALTVPVRHKLPTTDRITDVLAVGSDAWVAAGDSVLIVTPAGTVRKTVTGMSGVTGLSLSADGTGVFVSAGAATKIFQVSTAGTVLDSWTSQACPGRSGLASGALWYAYGCSAADRGVARLDPATGVDTSVLTGTPESLTAAGSTVVSYGSSGGITAYGINDDGTLTKRAGADNDTNYGAELSADGRQVLTTRYAKGYGFVRYDTTTMAQTGTFTTGSYPTAVAWSPDGKRFAGILDGSGDTRPVQVFSTSDGSATTRSGTAGSTVYTNDAHEAAWSADGRYIYFPFQPAGGNAYLAVAPAAGQARDAVAVTVTPARAYGRNLKLVVRTTPKRAGVAVPVSVTQNGAVSTRVLTTNSAGIADWALPARANGTVSARTPTDLTWLGATGSARFSTPGSVSAKLSGASRTVEGVAHYTAITKVAVDFQQRPEHAGRIEVQLQQRSGKTWKTLQRMTFTAEGDGSLPIAMQQGAKKVTYRFAAKALGDTTAAASPTVTSPSFVVD
ncbi:WD40 repeat domain-containing protein [Actinoplanes rectilineatus]|uniref:WD40 repeat domain-containing protein n=1 Tax=Actinoplanes rectilineatus TaxID=113571 RepID=UPI0005F2A277|nr:PD40 domain-containing protein [Actinoplanes rectilineatus]